MPLTNREISSFVFSQPPGRRDVRWDDELKGFGVRVYASGRKAFIVSYRRQGRKRLITLGDSKELSLKAARDKARETLSLCHETIHRPMMPTISSPAPGSPTGPLQLGSDSSDKAIYRYVHLTDLISAQESKLQELNLDPEAWKVLLPHITISGTDVACEAMGPKARYTLGSLSVRDHQSGATLKRARSAWLAAYICSVAQTILNGVDIDDMFLLMTSLQEFLAIQQSPEASEKNLAEILETLTSDKASAAAMRPRTRHLTTRLIARGMRRCKVINVENVLKTIWKEARAIVSEEPTLFVNIKSIKYRRGHGLTFKDASNQAQKIKWATAQCSISRLKKDSAFKTIF